MSQLNQALKKLHAARSRLILDRPFIGSLLMHLPLVSSRRCHNFATDARALYFNPAHVESLSFTDVRFMLAHEALHCALLHFHRRGHRLAERWDRACDYCVNQLLCDDGLTPPLAALLNPMYRGLSAEEIYAALNDEPATVRLDEHYWFGRSGVGELSTMDDLSGAEAGEPPDDLFIEANKDGFDELSTRGLPLSSLISPEGLACVWRDRLAASAIEAATAGTLGSAFSGALDQLIQPRLPWRSLLARFLMTTARDDYSFNRLSRREGEALLPSLSSTHINLVLALDTSGSIHHSDFRDFLHEIDALKSQIRARVSMLACDAALAAGGPWHFEPWQAIQIPDELSGGGGTRFTPVFDWVDAQAMHPDALLYFTDAQGEFPLAAPAYPVLWLVKGNAPVPWGERIQLN